MKVIFNLVNPCILRHVYAGIFNTPADYATFHAQWGYCCSDCRMNTIGTCSVKTCGEYLQFLAKMNWGDKVWKF